MQISPTWLSPAERSLMSHISLSKEDLDLGVSAYLEPVSHLLSFDRVTHFSYSDQRWQCQNSTIKFSWRETVNKVALYCFFFMLAFPMKYYYSKKIQEVIAKERLVELENQLKESSDPHQIFLLKMDIIAEKLRRAPDHERVLICQSHKRFQCKTEYDAMQYHLPHAILAHIDSRVRQQENQDTITFFLEAFGRERGERLFKMAGVDSTYYLEHKLGLNRKQIVRFLALTAFVHIEDMEHLYETLLAAKKKEEGHLHLNKSKVAEVVEKFNGKGFEELNKEQYDLLWDIMVPLSLSTMFVDKLDKDEPDQERGSSVDSIIQGLYVEQNHLRNRPNMSQRDFDYTLAKSLIGGFKKNSDVSIQGRVIRQNKFYGRIHSMISAAGCYCIPVEAMGATRRNIQLESVNEEGMFRSNAALSRLVFLPMQTFAEFLNEKWESMAGAIQENMGVKGALAIRPHLEKLRKNKAFKEVDAIGISMGGTQLAKLLTIWIKEKKTWVRKATMVCAPAEHETISHLFAKLVKEKEESVEEGQYLIKLRSIWQWGDCVHSLGQMELSHFAIEEDIQRVEKGKKPLIKQKIHWYHKEDEQDLFKTEMPLKQRAPLRLIGAIYRGYISMMGPHRDDIVVDGQHGVCSLSSVKHKKQIMNYLDNRDLGWENLRMALIKRFGINTSANHFVDAIKTS